MGKSNNASYDKIIKTETMKRNNKNTWWNSNYLKSISAEPADNVHAWELQINTF